MKKIFFLIITLLSLNTSAQEKIITSKVNEAIVFLESAQITRNKTIEIPKGITTLKFTKLSPFIDASSIQVKNKDVEIQAVNFQKNYLQKESKKTEVAALDKKLKKAQEKLQLQRTYKVILTDEIKFLKENSKLSGKDRALTTAQLREATTYYASKLKSLRLKEIEYNKNIENLNKNIRNIRKQIADFSANKDFANGEIIIKVNSKFYTNTKFSLVYNVGNAGWFPSYDIRVKDIENPINLVYKANVKQNTKVDWNDVKISFSSAQPNTSSEAPELKTYFLDYGSLPPTYGKNIKKVTGVVKDQDGEALPGVSILVKGTTIGTESDFDGKYEISIPNYASSLEFRYLGYTMVERRINNSSLNVILQEDNNVLEEIVVTGYSKRSTTSKTLKGKSAGVSIRGTTSLKADNKYSIPTNQKVNQTTVNFEILGVYSVKSDNKSKSVGMKTYNLPAKYQYFSIPKIDKNAFLIAKVTNWEQYNLLEGEANIYFENTYIGKSILDTRFTKDNLEISLGKDKNVVVQREKAKDYTTRQFIGSKKEEFRSWAFTIKNNKTQAINLVIEDQVPVSTKEEIKVEVKEVSNGKLDSKTGKITWNLNLFPSQAKLLNLKYSVKYPKSRNLIID